jgi:integrase
MITDSDGNLTSSIRLDNTASKGPSGGRVIPLNQELKRALLELYNDRSSSPYVIVSERRAKVDPIVVVNLFATWYRTLSFRGCSSHSGRRTFITNAARQISMVGGSLRDVQVLAGHAALSTTQRYIEADVEAQRRVVDLL